MVVTVIIATATYILGLMGGCFITALVMAKKHYKDVEARKAVARLLERERKIK